MVKRGGTKLIKVKVLQFLKTDLECYQRNKEFIGAISFLIAFIVSLCEILFCTNRYGANRPCTPVMRIRKKKALTVK